MTSYEESCSERPAQNAALRADEQRAEGAAGRGPSLGFSSGAAKEGETERWYLTELTK